ncbi:MAG: hypothetical protein ACT4QC_15920 [Planctomycetaceae bacterium]
MAMLARILDPRAMELLGWGLVHFVWQGAGLALILVAALRLLRHASPQARYVVACAALGLMAACPPLTIAWLSARDDGSTFFARGAAGERVGQFAGLAVASIDVADIANNSFHTTILS